MQSIIHLLIATLSAMTWMAIPSAQSAEKIKIGLVKTSTFGPFFIARDRGYFAKEGLDADFVFFDAPITMAPAVVAGAIDFATVNANGAFLNLAAQGAVTIIAGGAHEEASFHDFVIVASASAFNAGLNNFRMLPGHTAAAGTVGSPQAYSLHLLEGKYGLDPTSIRSIPVPSIPASVSAVVGGSADFGINPTTAFVPAIAHGEVKVLGYVGDETPWQIGVVFTSRKTADEKSDIVRRFLQAYQHATKDYHDAFTSPTGVRANGPTAQAVLAIMAKYLDQTPQQIEPTIAYFDAGGRLDEADFLRQVAWYQTQGVMRPEADGRQMLDERYVTRLPAEQAR